MALAHGRQGCARLYSVSGSASRCVGYELGEGSELLGAVFLPVVVA